MGGPLTDDVPGTETQVLKLIPLHSVELENEAGADPTSVPPAV